MNTSELNDELQKLSALDNSQKSAILKIIDLKTNSDMDKVLDKMDARFSRIDAKFSGIDAKFSGIEHKIDGVQKLVFGALIAFGVVLATAIISIAVNYIARFW